MNSTITETVSIDEQIEAMQSELRSTNLFCYHEVGAGRMTQQAADRRIARLQAVLGTLNTVKAPSTVTGGVGI